MDLDVEQFTKDITELLKQLPFILIWLMYLLFKTIQKSINQKFGSQ